MVLCIAGKKKGQLSLYLVQAYKAARWHNPHKLQQEGQRYYIELDGEKVWLSDSLERLRFALRCTCQQYHFRYCTLDAIEDEDSLICQFCEHGTEQWRRQNKAAVPQCEVEAMQAWRDLRLDYAVACQVQLGFWHGCVDFYHMPTKLVVQIDGSSHFKGTRRVLPWQQLSKDLDCCAEAWNDGVRMLRIHHQHGHMAVAMLAAVKMPSTSFVMLSHNYSAVSICMEGRTMSFVDWVAEKLGNRIYRYDSQSACYVFK
jgi:very-short-patch-repair endonuclease